MSVTTMMMPSTVLMTYSIQDPCAELYDIAETNTLKGPVRSIETHNSTVLLSEEREYLDCIEYQAVRLLSYVVPTYLIAWQLFGCVTIGAYMACNERVAAAANAVNPWHVSRHL
jgi:hypothetical protein